VDFYEGAFDEVTPGIRQITIEHLLTMASGLHWGDDPRTVNAWLAQANWLKKVFELRIAHQPGSHFEYKPDPRLLSWIIEQVTGTNVLSFAKEHLFRPLGIKAVNWPEEGVGDGIQLKPQDIAKLGYLYLRKGNWEGKKLLSPDYIAAATQVQIQGHFPENDGYGYLWWVSEIGKYRTFYASGFGGQYLFVVPELDIVVVITSTMDRPHIENKALIQDWLLTIKR
jgi:CubicO group peptidase (beta-lactamase class C family)